MKICFVQQSYREQFGIMYLSAICKREGHQTDVYIYSREKTIPEADIYAVSSSTPSYPEDEKIIKMIKLTTNKPIILGGPHPTYNHVDTKYLDAVVVGEGYEAIIDFIKEVKLFGVIHYPIRYDVRPLYNINNLPMPDYGLYYDKYQELRDKPTKQVYIVRGCPYHCAFCYNPAYNRLYETKGKITQCMDIDKAMSEIKELHDKWGFKWLQFISDTMNLNNEWFTALLKRYHIEIGKPYLCNVRVNAVTEALTLTMKETGCSRVDFGVEHGDTFIRNIILNRNMPKKMMVDAGKWFRKAGIRVQTTNIFGLPEESLNNAIQTVKLNREIRPEIAKACVLQPFKGTDIYKYAESQGLLQNMDINSGTTFQRDFEGRGGFTKIKLKDEKKLIRMSYLLDLFVQQRWLPTIIIKLICSLPLDKLYKRYYNRAFHKIEQKYI